MQTSAPELIDLAKEDKKTLELYGADARQAVVRQQLPAGPPARRARRALRAAVPHRLGPPRRRQRQPRHRPGPRRRRRSIGRAWRWCRISNARGCSTTRWSSGAASSAARRWARTATRSAATITSSPCTMWLAGGGVKAGLNLGKTDEHRLRRRRGQGTRPRPAGDGAAPAGPGSHQADVQVPGPRLPPDRRPRRGGQEAAGVMAMKQ